MQRRIAVLGISGSGKSTFSRTLAAKTSLPLYHMDQLFWKENWEAVSETEYLKAHEELVRTESWIIEGYIDKAMANRAQRADLILYLDYPGVLCFWRGLKRILRYHGKTRPELPQGCYDRFNHNFLWIILTRAERKSIEEALEGIEGGKVKRFKSPRHLEAYLATIE